MSTIVAALLRERSFYVKAGLPGRVALVDAELKRLGYKPKAEEKADDEAVASGGDEVETAVAGPTEMASKRRNR